MNNPPYAFLVEGELLRDVSISPEDMARMNSARETFKELKCILMIHVIPALGGWDNPIASEIEARIESITFGSGNFLWPHRYAGASHDAVNAGGAQ